MNFKYLDLHNGVSIIDDAEVYDCPLCGSKPSLDGSAPWAKSWQCAVCDFSIGNNSNIGVWNSIVWAILEKFPPKRFKNAPDADWEPACEEMFGEAYCFANVDVFELATALNAKGVVLEFDDHEYTCIPVSDMIIMPDTPVCFYLTNKGGDK